MSTRELVSLIPLLDERSEQPTHDDTLSGLQNRAQNLGMGEACYRKTCAWRPCSCGPPLPPSPASWPVFLHSPRCQAHAISQEEFRPVERSRVVALECLNEQLLQYVCHLPLHRLLDSRSSLLQCHLRAQEPGAGPDICSEVDRAARARVEERKGIE